MPDRKTAQLAGGGLFGDVGFSNEAAHLLLQRIDQAFDLRSGAFQDQFDAAIGEVFDEAVHIVLQRKVLNRVSKPDPLHAAAEVTRPSMKRRCDVGS